MVADPTPRGFRGCLVVALASCLGITLPGVAHADAVRDRQWHLDFLDLDVAHRISRGEGVTVAVLDSGVDHRHPDLQDGALLKGYNFSDGRRDGWEDANGHGTAMASLIAARGHGPGHRDGVLGVAPAARILPVRVEGAEPGDSRGLIQGLLWAADHGADVISVSLADFHLPELEEATAHALRRGAVVVAGVGNTARGDDEVMWPARYPGVVAVSGTDQDGGFTDASVTGPQVVLSAPATGIVTGSSGNRGWYSTGTGTSASTAIVSGVAALVKARYPDLDAANIINRLIATADDRGPQGRDPQYGYGIVDPVAALTREVPRVDANPLIGVSGATGVAAGRGKPTGGGGDATGWRLLAVGTVAGLALVILGLGALARRRRLRTVASLGRPATGHAGAGHHSSGRLRPPVPPGVSSLD